MTAIAIGLDGGERDRARLEHAALELARCLPEVRLVCTHHVAEDGGHYGASLLLGEPPGPARVARFEAEVERIGYAASLLEPGLETYYGDLSRATTAHALAARLAERQDGRAIEFAGQSQVGELTTVGELLRRTAIDHVVALGADIDEASPIETNRFLRPRFEAGRLVLHLTPLAGGRFRPFEVPSPHQCCAHDH